MTSPITTHVLDLANGRPAAGVAVALAFLHPDGGWDDLGRSTTDADGRARDLLPPGSPMEPGTYRLRFETLAYFQGQGVPAFHPWVEIPFLVEDPGRHHHVPLLLSPFGYSTYRGAEAGRHPR